MKHSVKEYKVAGGASGLIVDVPGSDVVCLQVRFNSGYQFTDQDRYEVPHVMEHLLATVTKNHPGPNEFHIEAQKNGAYVNATTSSDANGYVYEFADFELDRMIDLVEEQLTAPLFAEEALRAELGNVREELVRNTTQHARVCSIKLGEQAFPHLMMDFEARIAQLDRIDLASVEQHYAKTHTAANAKFYVAGSFADGGVAVVKRLDKLFGRLPVGELLQRSQTVGHSVEEPIVTEKDIKQLYYRVSMYFGDLTASERRALALLRMVLAGGLASRVLGEARQQGLAYSVGATSHAEPGNSSFGFAGYVTPPNVLKLFELMVREFVAVRAGAVTSVELDAAKDLVVGSIKRATQTPGDILAWYMGGYDERSEINDFEHHLELVRDVTPQEVAAVAVKATAGQRKGFSYLGEVDKAMAQKYNGVLNSLWQ